MILLYYCSVVLLLLAFLLCLLRIAMGPDLTDRIVAFDLLTNVLISFIALYAVYFHQSVYLNIIIVIALVMFLGSTMFTRYIEETLNKNKLDSTGR